MNKIALIVGIIMMAILPLTKFIKTGGIMTVIAIPLFLGGLIAFIVGVAGFTNVQNFSNVEKEEKII